MNKHVIIVLLMAVIMISACQNKSEIPESPNVIFIFPDQYRNYSMGFWSKNDHAKYLQGKPDPVITPAIDKLAEGGIVFNRAMSNFPLCSPYRGMLLSGMYPDHNGLTANCRADRDVQLKTELPCITDIFSQNGYEISYFGKCHWQKTEPLFDEDGNYKGTTEAPGGHYVNRYDTYVPPGADRHSIDYFFQALKDEHFNPRVYSSDPLAIEGKKDGELYMPHRFSAEIESEKIMNWLDNSHGQRNVDKPFMMIWALNPPHNPWTEESTYMEFFDLYTKNGKADYNQLLTHDNADSISGDYAPYYFANVTAVDHFIGKVMDKLEELGIADNTIIAFSSDHGEMLGSHGKQGKNVPEHESFNIPLVIKWGNNLKHRIDDLIMSVPDMMPTLLGLAGLGDAIPATVQGNDYSDILLHNKKENAPRPKSALFINYASRGIYTGDQTFVVTEKGGNVSEAFVYDNVTDPYQLTKIPLEKVENRKELKKELVRLLKETNDRWYQQGICKELLAY